MWPSYPRIFIVCKFTLNEQIFIKKSLWFYDYLRHHQNNLMGAGHHWLSRNSFESFIIKLLATILFRITQCRCNEIFGIKVKLKLKCLCVSYRQILKFFMRLESCIHLRFILLYIFLLFKKAIWCKIQIFSMNVAEMQTRLVRSKCRAFCIF